MEKNSQPPAKLLPKTTQASSNHVLVPMAARTAPTASSADQPQRGTAVGSVQQHPQPLSRSMFGTTAQRGATMPRPPTAAGSLACIRPVQQTNPVVFGQGSSSSNQAMQGSSNTQAVAATALAAAAHGPTAQDGAAMPLLLPPAALLAAPRRVRQRKRTTRPSSPPPPKLPVYRHRPPPPPRSEVASSSAAGNAVLQSPSDTGFRVSNIMQANPPPSPGQVASAEEASNSEGGGSSRGVVKMLLDLNLPPVSDEEN